MIISVISLQDCMRISVTPHSHIQYYLFLFSHSSECGFISYFLDY